MLEYIWIQITVTLYTTKTSRSLILIALGGQYTDAQKQWTMAHNLQMINDLNTTVSNLKHLKRFSKILQLPPPWPDSA